MITSDAEQALVDQLRHEANAVKECFNGFMFKGLTLACVAFGFTFSSPRQPLASLTVLPVIVVLGAICRIGIYKFDTANRHFGYELHLERLRTLMQAPNIPRQRRAELERIRGVGWEEACRAWRVVQVSIFECVYRTPSRSRKWYAFAIVYLRNRLDWRLYHVTPVVAQFVEDYAARVLAQPPGGARPPAYPWFLPQQLTSLRSEKSIYYTGTYLKTMIEVLVITQFLLLVPMVVALKDVPLATLPPKLCWSGLVVVAATLIVLRSIRMHRRREVLENELLSIHSWAVMWHYVAKQHLAAIDSAGGTYGHYTETLAAMCQLDVPGIMDIPNLL